MWKNKGGISLQTDYMDNNHLDIKSTYKIAMTYIRVMVTHFCTAYANGSFLIKAKEFK